MIRRPFFVASLVFILGIIFYFNMYGGSGDEVKSYSGSQITLIAQIDEMTGYGDDISFIAGDVIRDSGERFCDRIKVYQKKNYRTGESICSFYNLHLKTGNIVEMTGDVKDFEKPGNPGQFNELEYYREMGLECRMTAENVHIISDETDLIADLLYRVRGWFVERLEEGLPEREAGVVAAMLLGEKSGLDDEVKELYRENGIGHLLAVSGLHVSMIGVGIFFLLRRFIMPMRVAVVVTMGLLFFYGMLCGFPVSTQRAVIMMFVMLGARLFGRRYDRLSAIGIAAVIVLLLQPESLFSSGFLLSFGTVLGIELFLNGFVEICSDKNIIWKVIGGALGIYLITAPIIVQFYYELPVYSVISNALLLPLFGYLVTASAIGGITMGLWSFLGSFVLGVSYWILRFYELICRLFGSLPVHEIVTGVKSPGVIVFYYLLLILAVYSGSISDRIIRIILKVLNGRKNCFSGENNDCSVHLYGDKERNKKQNNKQENKRIMIWCARLSGESIIKKIKVIIIVVALVFLLVPWENYCSIFETEERIVVKGLSIVNLDVGQGDCAVLRGDGFTVLIDGGSSSVNGVGRYRIVPFLKFNGISRIDYIFISHSDEDHVSGIEEILQDDDHFGLEIGTFIMPGIINPDENYVKLEKEAKDAGIRVRKMDRGDAISLGQMRIACLHPETDYAWEDANDYSATLALYYGKFKALFTGDLGVHGEEKIADELEDFDYLKVGHHGSKNSSGEEFLEKIKPEIAVASAGKNNRYGHPASEAVERIRRAGANFYCTIEQGAVTTWTDGEQIRVDGYKQLRKRS